MRFDRSFRLNLVTSLLLFSLLFLLTGCGGGSTGGSTNPPNPTPTLSAISPASASVGAAAVTVTATGTGFMSSSVIQWNGAALITTFVSSTSLQAQVPATSLTSAGTGSVTVVNPAPGGGTSSTLNFTIAMPNPVPIVNVLGPDLAVAGEGAFTLTVTGSQFIATSQVLWNGSARPTTFASSTSLSAQISASDVATAGIATVSVMNPPPGGGTSTDSTFPVFNPTPTISALSPSSAIEGGNAFTLTVTGTLFLPNAEVLWNQSILPTTFLSSTSLTAQVSASDLAAAETAWITVVTPGPGGTDGGSLPVTFPVKITPKASNLTVLDLEGNDLVWDSQHNKIYVSVPGAATANANTITIVDPVAGTIGNSRTTGADPDILALSDDGQFLYADIAGDMAVQRFTLPALAPDIKWTVGSDSATQTTYTPIDVKVEPGAAHTVAVIRGGSQNPANAQVAIYDDGVMRSSVAPADTCFYNSLQWKTDGTQIYNEDNRSSTRQLCDLSVNTSGVSLQTTYGMAFRAAGNHLHLDTQTGYAYSDAGETVDASTGLPIGNYPTHRSLTITPVLSAVDSNLKRVFFLDTIQDNSGQNVFQLKVFDQTHFTLLDSFLIPNAVGTPTNFIRWGNSGLAFVTSGQRSTPPAAGKLYILDGAFVNPSGTLDSSIGTALNPVPKLTSLNPSAVPSGGDPRCYIPCGVRITIIGRDFAGQPTVYWNGTAVPTMITSDTELQTTIPPGDLKTPGRGLVTVVNSGPGGGTSNALPLNIGSTGSYVYDTGGNDLVWDPTAQMIYVSVPSVQGDFGNTIAIVDPLSGPVGSSPFIGSDPGKLAMSSDGQYLLVSLNGGNSIQRMTINRATNPVGLTPDLNWHLGADSFNGPYYALDLLAAPGAPHTTAVSAANFDVSPSSAGITIYDDATPRPTVAPGWNKGAQAYASTQWGSDASALYASAQSQPTDFYALAVMSTGITLTKDYPNALSFTSPDFAIHFDAATGLIYTDGGQVVDPTNGTIVGDFHASGMVVLDSTLKGVFFLGQSSSEVGTTDYMIQVYDQQKFTLIGAYIVPNVVGTPTAFIRWGDKGLAFTTRVGSPTSFYGIGAGQLYVVDVNFVTYYSATSTMASPLYLEHVRKTWGSPKEVDKPAHKEDSPF